MALAPLVLSDLWNEMAAPQSFLEPNLPNRLEVYLLPRKRSSYYRPWSNMLSRSSEEGSSVVQADKDKFQVVLDVQQFEPNEIDVKAVDNFIVVTAKHDDKRDEHGFISRQFVRKYVVPTQCEIEQATSKLSSDGILTIIVPRKEQPKVENERIIKIECTGKPAVQAKPAKQKQKQIEKEKKEEEK